jgi:hypothetical protein
MFEAFANPWAMAAGIGLVSSPIIIHLINRVRFRRVKWAAMEFLLKSQKRTRRKLIIEQLILLLLRILLVLLAGFLLARFSGCGGAVGEQGTTHVLLLDDSPSTADALRDGDGKSSTALTKARDVVVREITEAAARAGSVQSIELFRLSDLGNPLRIDRVGPDTADNLAGTLRGYEPSLVHTNILTGIRRCREALDRVPGRKMLHVVSDFRALDLTSTELETVSQDVKSLTDTRVPVNLVDVADPPRKEGAQAVPSFHDNIGIVDLQPEARVVARGLPVEFTVTLANYGTSPRQNLRVNVRVNDEPRPREDASFTIPNLPAGTRNAGFTFVVTSFDRTATRERPLDGHNLVTVSIDDEDTGLNADNRRYASVEVREKVPILMVEGDPATRGKPESDAFYLSAIFKESVRGYDIVTDGPRRLEQPGLDAFAAVMLLNVPRLSDAAVKNLEAYTAAGGGVGFFLGDQCKPDFYDRLYDGGKGVFPAPLAGRPSEPLDEEQKLLRNFDVTQLKAFPRDESHPILKRIYQDDKKRENSVYLKYVGIDRYFPVRPGWRPDAGVEEVLTLPNDRTIDDYKAEVQKLLGRLPDDARNANLQAALRPLRTAIIEELANGRQLYKLAGLIDRLLNPPAGEGDAAQLAVKEYWQKPESAELRAAWDDLLRRVRYGDPLLLAKRYGKGRVTAFFTTAGAAWTNFPRYLAQPYYVMLMIEIQKYLSGTGGDTPRLLGPPLALEADALRYAPKLHRWVLGDPEQRAAAGQTGNLADLGELNAAEVKDGKATFATDAVRRPGVYLFQLASRNDDPASATPADVRAVAVNFDTAAEGDLRRPGNDELREALPGAKVFAPGGGLSREISARPGDWSESPWIYLVFLLVLLAEQAMAVRLSFHTRDPIGQ